MSVSQFSVYVTEKILLFSELSTEIFSEAQKGKSLKRLYLDDAAELTRNACVSPCSLVLALLYLERLKTCNPDYISNIAPAELFLVSLVHIFFNILFFFLFKKIYIKLDIFV